MDKQERVDVRCEHCGRPLKHSEKIVYLEYSQDDGRYYNSIPDDHISQGGFPFGSDCAKKVAADQKYRE
jgi:hypothetical protein